jgi:three-Cys-motif partner protein
MSKEHIVAADDMVARDNGAWALDKLSFIDEFVPAALLATRRKRQRFFVDLFAGPGINIDANGSGEEFVGSALRALSAYAPGDESIFFTHAVLVNLAKRDHDALSKRIKIWAKKGYLFTKLANIELLNGNANRLVNRIMRSIDPKAYAFIIADIEAPKQLPWSSVKAIKSQGHSSVDLFVLFPLDMALRRMLSYRQATVDQSARVLDEFFGCEDWRLLLKSRVTNSQSSELGRNILNLYMSRLKELGWAHVMIVRDVKRMGDCGLYKMIYASNHEAGNNIARWSADDSRRKGQLEIF